MEESVDIRQVSCADEESIDEDTVGHEFTVTAAAAATADVTGVITGCDVWERMSNSQDHQPDVDDDVAASTSEDGGRVQRRRQLAMMEELLETAMNDVDDADDWERFFGARDELLRLLEAGVLDDIERAAFDEAERLSELWTEVLETQRRGTTVDRRATETCAVCLELVKLDRRPCCELPVCEACMTKYVQSHLEQTGAVHIGCPNTACSRFVFHEEVRELLRWTPDLRERYDRWMVDANADPRRKTCPRCCRITEMQPSQRPTGKYGVMVSCPDCQLDWCFACQSPWHGELTCAKNRQGDELLKKWARQRIRDEHNAQRCPSCKVRHSQTNTETAASFA